MIRNLKYYLIIVLLLECCTEKKSDISDSTKILNSSIKKQCSNISRLSFDTAYYNGDSIVLSIIDSLEYIQPITQEQKITYALFELSQLNIVLKNYLSIHIWMPNRDKGSNIDLTNSVSNIIEYSKLYQNANFRIIVDYIFLIDKQDSAHHFLASLDLEVGLFMVEKKIPGSYTWGIDIFPVIAGYIDECNMNKKGGNSQIIDNLINKKYSSNPFFNIRKKQLFTCIKNECN